MTYQINAALAFFFLLIASDLKSCNENKLIGDNSCIQEERGRGAHPKVATIFTKGTPRSDQLKRINQERMASGNSPTNKENGSPSPKSGGNVTASFGSESSVQPFKNASSPRFLSDTHSKSPKLLKTSDELVNNESPLNPFIVIDEPTHGRKKSVGKTFEEENRLVIPLELRFSKNALNNPVSVVLNIPQVSQETKIVLSFHFSDTEKEESLPSPKKKITRKRTTSSPSKNSPIEQEVAQFLFDEEIDSVCKKSPTILMKKETLGTMSTGTEEIPVQIRSHVKKHQPIICGEGLKRIKPVLEKIKYFCDLQMFLRGDNAYIIDSLMGLLDDYRILFLFDQLVPEKQHSPTYLEDILHYNQDVFVAAHKNVLARYQEQEDAMSVMLCEYGSLYETREMNLIKTSEMNPKLIRENIDLMSQMHLFFKENIDLIKAIEDERGTFIRLLRRFSDPAIRELKAEKALKSFDSLIQKHEEAAAKKERMNQTSASSSFSQDTLKKKDFPSGILDRVFSSSKK